MGIYQSQGNFFKWNSVFVYCNIVTFVEYNCLISIYAVKCQKLNPKTSDQLNSIADVTALSNPHQVIYTINKNGTSYFFSSALNLYL